MPARRIAIVGFGPRGLGALERLVARHEPATSGPLEVTIFEPHPAPGAGPAYAPDQAPFLLMNFPAAKIDLNWRGEGAPSALGVGSFSEWTETDTARTASWYPPRAMVGKYLAAAAKEMLAFAPFPVELHRESVVEVIPANPGWMVQTPSGSSRFDEVLLTVGHAPPSTTTARSSDVNAGDAVDIRGFGLTAIDLILELTEGRGGRFEPDADGLRYVGTAGGPSMLLPHTRHGRSMRVKPELVRSPVPEETAVAAIAESRRLLLDLPPGCGIGELGSIVATLAGELLGSVDGKVAAEEWIRSARTARLVPDEAPTGPIAVSLRISDGRSAPDLGWALGLAWRSIYPAIVARFSHGGLPQQSLEEFRLLATELERLAFGPPPVNGAKLLALIAAGVLDLSELGRSTGQRSRITIDAVSAAPGLQLHQNPLPGLVACGAVSVPGGCRGIEVTWAARCVGADGEPTPGLAACGRLTEDWVIGNDTLDRSLHPEIDGWAASVCGARSQEVIGAVST